MYCENEEQVWNELDQISSRACVTTETIDDALRDFLNLATRACTTSSVYDVARFSQTLLYSPLFAEHNDYVRRQMVQSLLQDEDSNPDMLLFVTFLLLDIRENEATAELLNEQGAFTRLVDLIADPGQKADTLLHRMLMDLLYEMSRVQRIKLDDLLCVDDAFVCQLFELIEELSNDVNDPYHYPIIRVILVLNEQYMVAGATTNRVIKILSANGSRFKTFGADIIILLNRETETSLQLLSLKLLYLLFTTPSTQEYFYTNDLHVLVDILIRNLLDLPPEAAALRHTYLRVLYPLLAHTQLKLPPHYKCAELQKLLTVLAGSQRVQGRGHFEEEDATTKRLVARCRTVLWLKDPETTEAEIQNALDNKMSASPVDVVGGEKVPPVPPVPRKLRKRNPSKTSHVFLAPQLDSARESALSMMEVAVQREKPGVITPSKRASWRDVATKKEKPLPPNTRRSTWSRRARDMESRSPEKSTGDGASGLSAEQAAQHGDGLDGSATALSPPHDENDHAPLTKKPPPAPKARQWRGKRRKKDDEGGGPPELPKGSPAQTFPIEKTLSGSETGSPGASVAEALYSAQAEAMSGIGEALERAHLSSTPAPAPEMKAVLTPPSPAPPRGVPGPTFSLERSPFIGEDEDD